MGMNNLPMGVGSQPHPTLPSPFQNPRPSVHPQLPAQPNPNPNNNISLQYVQILKSSYNVTKPIECNELRLKLGHIIYTK